MGLIKILKKLRHLIVEAHVEYQKYNTKYVFENRSKNSKIMLFVLSGYKPYLWKDVFSRIKNAELDNMDICIVSSGLYNKELSKICLDNEWSYLSTKLNNVCVASNVTIRLFPKAEYIFKLDEDIYLGKTYFKDMINGYTTIINEHPEYKVGYIFPILPLGHHCMFEFLKTHNALVEYEKRFGKLYIGGTYFNPKFRENVGIDAFIWEKIGNIDDMIEEYRNKEFSYFTCPTRSGIAAILFTREFWDTMGGVKRPSGFGVGSDGDEGQITSYCAINYYINCGINNVFVGHFAFGGSEPEILKLKEMHPNIFKSKNNENC